MKKRWDIVGVLFFFCIFSSYGLTWTVTPALSSYFYYFNSSQSSSKSFTVKRDNGTGSARFYLLVSNATYGSAEPGSRKAYLNGDENGSSIQIFLRPSSGTTEIGTDNIAGTVNISGTMSSGTKSKTVGFKVVTGSGPVPDGTYSNVFTFQLFTGSTSSGSGTPLSVFGTLTVTISVYLGSNFNIQLSPTTVSFGSALLAGYSYSANATLTVTAPKNFTIAVFSLHSGYLYLSEDEKIAYDLYFNNSSTATNLKNESVVLVASSVSVNNISYPLSFVTEMIDFIEPGLYTDNVIFTFTAD